MIDKKKLIEAIWDKYNLRYNNAAIFDETETRLINEVLSEMQTLIDAQPKVDEWIPCSERLPKDGEEVLVWFEYFRYGNYNCLYQTRGISYMFDGKWSGFVNGTCGWKQLRIIAWQPLPDDYKECDKSESL